MSVVQDEERRIASVIGRKEDEKKRETSKMAALTVNVSCRLTYLSFSCLLVDLCVRQ